jgi:tRNA pseudouridine(55) synthase
LVQPTRQRIQRRALHGVLLLDKPLGWTSNDALQKAKGILRAEKAGHTGTLDPLATACCRCASARPPSLAGQPDADKAYRAAAPGQRTSTGREGEVVEACRDRCERIAAACARFTGTIDQLPPMHSALKKDGKALYEYARAGVEVERPTRRVSILSIDIVEWQDATLVIDVRCTKGTYIRTLAEDIGGPWDAEPTCRPCVAPRAGRSYLRPSPSRPVEPERKRACCRMLLADASAGAGRRRSWRLPACVAACHGPTAACCVYGQNAAPSRHRPSPRRADRRPPVGPTEVYGRGSRIVDRPGDAPGNNPSTSRQFRKPTMTDSQHRHHRARRRQDHAGRPAAAPERHLPRQREGGRARDGQQRPREGTRHHDPVEELRGRVEGHARQHRRHARARRLRR